jgi:hypothetical protein
VVDTLVGAAPLTIDAWLAGFSLEGLVVVGELPGEHYLFNDTEVPPLDKDNYPMGLRQFMMARNVFRGEFWKYDGKAAAEHWAASPSGVRRGP